MALSEKQIRELNIASMRRNNTDLARLNEARSLGYQDKMAPAFTPPAGTTRIPNPASISQYSNITKDPNSNAMYGTIKRTQDGGVQYNMPEIDNLNTWKNQTNFLETAKDIIKQKQGMNQDINNLEQYWSNVYRLPEQFGNTQMTPEQPAGTNPVGTFTDESFRQLSPADQATIRQSRMAVARTNLDQLQKERTYRETRATDTIDYITNLYKEKQDALKLAQDQKNTEAELALRKESNNISLLSQLNQARENGDTATANLISNRLESNGVKVGEYTKNNLPDPYTPVTSSLGSGHVSAYGSFAWKNGLDYVLDGGSNADIVLPFNFEIVSMKNNGNWGNQVKVKNLETGKEMWFSHLSKFANLGVEGKSTNRFPAGTSIGKQGSTGLSTGNHIDITMPKKGGGYYSATDVAKELGLGGQSPTSSGNRKAWTDAAVKSLAKNVPNIPLSTLLKYSDDELTELERQVAPSLANTAVKAIPAATLLELGITKDIAEDIVQAIYENPGEPDLVKTSLKQHGINENVYDKLSSILKTQSSKAYGVNE